MHDLIPLPPVFQVSSCYDLERRNQSPACPHEPSMEGGDFFKLVRSYATSIALQGYVEEAVVILMKGELIGTIRIESINHVDHLV